MFNLKGKVAIVTGASSGIGRATAVLLVRQGASVVINARRPDALDEVAEMLVSQGGSVHAVAGDVSDLDTQQRLVQAAVQNWTSLSTMRGLSAK